MLNTNDLKPLPPEITNLKNLKSLSLPDNPLTNLPPAIAQWARQFDPKFDPKSQAP